MAGFHERKHNKGHTRSLRQSNPDTDVCQDIVGNLSTRLSMAVIRAEELL